VRGIVPLVTGGVAYISATFRGGSRVARGRGPALLSGEYE